MDQISSHKVKQIINQRLDIDNPKKILLLSKMYHKAVHSLHYHPNKKEFSARDSFIETEVLSKVFEKIKVKPLKRLNLKKGHFLFDAEDELKTSRVIKLIKRYSRIQELIFFPKVIEESKPHIFKIRTFWLKYCKKLQRVEFVTSDYDEEKQYLPYIKQIQQSNLVWLHFKGVDRGVEPPEVCDFSKYPQTLKNLSLEIETLSTLPKLKNLQCLHLSFYEVPDIAVSSDLLGYLAKLKWIELKLIKFEENSETLMKRLSKAKNLKSFILERNDDEDTNILSKPNYFDYFESLEKLSLSFCTEFKDEDLSNLKLLVTKIVKIPKLRVLELAFMTIDEEMKPFLTAFKESLEKLTLLEELTFESLSSVSDPGIIFEIIPFCKKLPALKKLKLSLDWSELSEQSCNELCQVIKSLKNLKVLNLPMLTISSTKVLKNLIDCIVEKRTLEEFTIGGLEKSIPDDILIYNLKRLLACKGLKKVKITKQRKNGIEDSDRRNEFYKMLREVERENPEMNLTRIYKAITARWNGAYDEYWKQIFGEYGYESF